MITANQILGSYTGQQSWLPKNTFYMCLHGSHAYGTNVEGSDYDFKGVCVAPKSYSTGFVDRFEQAERAFGDYDGAIFDVRKFLSLAVDCNPSVLEVLWADPSTWLLNADSARNGNHPYYEKQPGATPWQKIYEARWSFLSQEAKARYSGYAVSQAWKLELHRQYLINPPKKKPEREDFGLGPNPEIPKEQREFYESQIQKVIEAWNLDFGGVDYSYRIELLNAMKYNLADMKMSQEDQYFLAAKKLGLHETTVESLKNERKYNASLKQWHQYQEWKVNRNPKRAEMEAKYGMDTKNAMHCIRLQRTCIEILEGKGVQVKRPDAEELVAIRNGLYTYDQWREEVRKLEDRATELLKTCTLPRKPDYRKASELCSSIVEKAWENQ